MRALQEYPDNYVVNYFEAPLTNTYDSIYDCSVYQDEKVCRCKVEDNCCKEGQDCKKPLEERFITEEVVAEETESDSG